ncbi:hypothetical protein FQN60_014743, partial [Etheostoma spectabile]
MNDASWGRPADAGPCSVAMTAELSHRPQRLIISREVIRASLPLPQPSNPNLSTPPVLSLVPLSPLVKTGMPSPKLAARVLLTAVVGADGPVNGAEVLQKRCCAVKGTGEESASCGQLGILHVCSKWMEKKEKGEGKEKEVFCCHSSDLSRSSSSEPSGSSAGARLAYPGSFCCESVPVVVAADYGMLLSKGNQTSKGEKMGGGKTTPSRDRYLVGSGVKVEDRCFRAPKWVSTTDAGTVWEQYVPKEESGMGRDEQRDMG